MRRCCFEGIDGSFWKVFSIVTHVFLPRVFVRLRTQQQRVDSTNAFVSKRSDREYTYTYIYIYILKQRRENEFWRHAPRGRRTEGNTQRTDLFSYAFSSLTRLSYSWLLGSRRAAMMRREIQSILFFSCFRAREFVSEACRYLFFLLRDDHPSLFLCAAWSIREGDRVFQNARSS